MELPKTDIEKFENLELKLFLTWKLNLIFTIWVKHQVCTGFSKKL